MILILHVEVPFTTGVPSYQTMSSSVPPLFHDGNLITVTPTLSVAVAVTLYPSLSRDVISADITTGAVRSMLYCVFIGADSLPAASYAAISV